MPTCVYCLRKRCLANCEVKKAADDAVRDASAQSDHMLNAQDRKKIYRSAKAKASREILAKMKPAIGARREVRGLPNLGNTCYANALVQCLLQCLTVSVDIHLSRGRVIVLDPPFCIPNVVSPQDIGRFEKPACCESASPFLLENVLANLNNAPSMNHREREMEHMLMQIGAICDEFMPGGQMQDPGELFLLLLNHAECEHEPLGNSLKLSNRVRLSCKNPTCGKSWESTADPMRQLTIRFGEGPGPFDLDMLIEEQICRPRDEKLVDGRCEHCGMREEGMMIRSNFEFVAEGDMIMVCMNRFNNGSGDLKDNRKIYFEEELGHIHRRGLGPTNGGVYKLSAMIVHQVCRNHRDFVVRN